MSYREALGAAGAEVLAYEQFGSYQGDWWARVKLSDGRIGWVNGSYGSCSGCDSFEAEFGYDEGRCDDHRWDISPVACDACASQLKVYRHRLAAFGATYLDGFMSQEKAEAEAARNIEWDLGAKEMVEFVKRHAEQP